MLYRFLEKNWFKKLGLIGFIFFLVKGLIWLALLIAGVLVFG